jgi:hypothetical protein
MGDNYFRGQRIKVKGKTERYKGSFGSAYIITAKGKRIKRTEVAQIK